MEYHTQGGHLVFVCVFVIVFVYTRFCIWYYVEREGRAPPQSWVSTRRGSIGSSPQTSYNIIQYHTIPCNTIQYKTIPWFEWMSEPFAESKLHAESPGIFRCNASDASMNPWEGGEGGGGGMHGDQTHWVGEAWVEGEDHVPLPILLPTQGPLLPCTSLAWAQTAWTTSLR